MNEEWFTLEEIEKSDTDDDLYCISVDSPLKQFLIGEIKAPTHNTEEGKEEDKLKGEAAQIIGSIARLGRASGVHLVLATQRPDAKLIPGETKANLGVRINCGYTNSTASSMILESGEGTRVKANPRGRLYLSIYGKGDHGQGFFAPQEWIDEYLKDQGLNPDGSPLSQPRSKLAPLTDMSALGEEDLDSISGVDNATIIEEIRESESNASYDQIMEDDDEVEETFTPVQALPTEPTKDNTMGRPELSGKAKKDQFHRAEDDWDDDGLGELIRRNNE